MQIKLGIFVCISLLGGVAEAQMGRYGGGGHHEIVENRSNRDMNINRNVNVNVRDGGGCYRCGYHDGGWGAGSFAAGAAVGALTTAAVAAASRPAVGTTVVELPGGCAQGAGLYNCGNVYYRPYYAGTVVEYQVVNP